MPEGHTLHRIAIDHAALLVGPHLQVSFDKRRVPKNPRRGETTYVYHRDRCIRCHTPIEEVRLAARPCYFCPRANQPDRRSPDYWARHAGAARSPRQ